MGSLEGSFFTGLDTGGGGVAIPVGEIAFGSGASITSNSNFFFTPGAGVTFANIGLVDFDGFYLSPANPGNNIQGVVAIDTLNAASARNDYALNIGYNPKNVAGDHSFRYITESYFNPSGVGQTEMYWEYFSPDHTVNFRPYGIVIPVEGGSINQATIQFNATSVVFNSGYTQTAIDLDFSGNGVVKTALATGNASFIVQNTTSGGNEIEEIHNGHTFDFRSLSNANGSGSVGGYGVFNSGILGLYPATQTGNLIAFWESGPGTIFYIDSIGNIGMYGYYEMREITAPAAGGANTVRVFAQDNGAGKTQLMALFNTGAAQQIAIQP